MDIFAVLASLFVFGIFTMLVLFALIAVSSISAVIIMLFVPVLAVLVMPKTVIAFLSYQHLLLANGMVPINNFHILLFIWSTLIGIILYTEFLTWYLARKTGPGQQTESEILDTVRAAADSVLSRIKQRP
ncbi:MAG: hypothetical protein JXA98_08160 [Methanosarcinaceae archaeon]|nr:hypothetical protein [Methanosarcinaceae archaeon]